MNQLHGITVRYTEAWGDSVSGQAAALKKLWLLAYREAQVQAFADAYLAIAVCFALSMMMVPLMRKRVSRGVPNSAVRVKGGELKITSLNAITPKAAEKMRPEDATPRCRTLASRRALDSLSLAGDKP